MFAKNLEHLLANLCRQSDLRIDPSEFAARFNALRTIGKLPRGRENRARTLNFAEIAAAIFGLVPTNPNLAGFAAAILADLRPVGGTEASFHGAASLTETVQHILTDNSARENIVSLALSVAEHSQNSNGFAILTYCKGETQQCAAFVSRMAVSLLQPGSEQTFNAADSYAPASRGVVFNRQFFDRIGVAVVRDLAFPEPPAGDGSEYGAEEAQLARNKALAVVPNSRFLNIGVDTQVTWPKQEVLVQFDRYQLVLMPKTKEYTQSIHVDLHANRLSDREAMTVINRFLSVLTWCDDQFAIAQDGWSGNPVPVAVPRRNLAFATAHHWVFDRRISASDHARRALALYREGRNAEESGLVSYSVLSYFKIIEIRYPDGARARQWIAENFSAVWNADQGRDDLKQFMTACGDENPADYIYNACRVAVAHASVKHPSDPDEADEIRRLYTASDVLRRLARSMISQELGVSDRFWSGD